MGSGFYTFEEAATRLGRSKRSLHDYVKKGLIKKRLNGRESVLDREDVELLASEQGTDYPSLNKKTFLKAQTRLQKLEDEMKMVKHILQIRDVQPLRPDPTTSLGLLSAAKTYLGVDREAVWMPALIEKWADIFERIDEETLSALVSGSNEAQAWIPFFKFCSQMADFCWEQDKKTPSLAWQAMGTRLETARQGMRRAIMVWLEMGGGTLPEKLLSGLEGPRDSFMRRMAIQTSS